MIKWIPFLMTSVIAINCLSGQDTGLRIDKNSVLGGLDGAQILLYENENDYARLRITNSLFDASTNNRFWDIAGRIGPNSSGLEDRLNFYMNGYGDILSLRGNGRVGIGTISPAATLDVNGFTKLGGESPNIKMKELYGTTSNDPIGDTSLVHGITDPSKIIAVNMFVIIETALIPPNYLGKYVFGSKGQILYYYLVDHDRIFVRNDSFDAIQPSPITSRAFKILITYKE